MWLALAAVCAAVLSLAGIFLYLDPQIPRAESYRNVQLETPLRIFSADGGLLAEFGERRVVPVTLEEVPAQFVNALLDTEDKRFYEHSGIDFISLANDSLALLGSLATGGGITAGASTITMQLARNISFSLDRQFLRKFKEMLLALKIEQELTKDEILELYINMAPFGKRAYGAQAASLTYYGKTLDELNLPQLAMLAGIPQRPSAANPINGPEAALKRRNVVLLRMFDQGSISEQEYQQAVAAPISARLFARELDVPSPYIAEWVRQQVAPLLPDLYSGGYQVFTTIDMNMQQAAQSALREGLTSYDEKHGYRGPEGTLTEAGMESVADQADALAALLTRDQVEPATIAPEVTALAEAIGGELDEIDDFAGLEAAIVLSVNDTHALVMRRSGEPVTLAMADALWARPYIDVDLRGPMPDTFSELLKAGDVIRIRFQEAAAEEEQPRWVLAQLAEVQGALIAMDHNDGAVRAMVGGYDFYRNQFNHATQAARQPGSGFKPFVYSAALQAGVTPADIFLDAPLVFDDANLESEYRPDNDNNEYNGPTRLREALYRSINLVSMRVLLKIGAGTVLDHAARFGFDTSTFPRNTQLAIGGGTMAVTPLDMARAYAVLANGGYMIEPYAVTAVEDAEGNLVYRPNHPQVCKPCEEEMDEAELDPALEPEPVSLEELLADAPAAEPLPDPLLDPTVPLPVIPAERVIDERNVFIMHSMLQDVIRRGTGRAAMRLQRNDLAGKTGTTNDAADTWFNGFSSNLVATVWVGFSDHAPLGATAYGSNTPLPIWTDFMEHALAGTDEVLPQQPPGVVTVKVDADTGERAPAASSNAIFEYFLQEHTPPMLDRPTPGNTTQEEDIRAIDLF